MKAFFRRIIRIVRLSCWFVFMACRTVRRTRKMERWEKTAAVAELSGEWARGILKILNMEIETLHAEERTEETGALIVSNHLGYVDIVVHAGLHGLRFAPKKEIRSWPVLGKFVGLSMPVWVDRTSKVKSVETLREFEETLRHNIPLIVYPEGTSTDGLHGLLPFKSTPFEAAIAGNHPILPVITVYRDPDGKMNPAWFGDQAFLPHLWSFLGLRGVRATVYTGKSFRANGMNRKELASKTHEVMSGMYRELFPGFEMKGLEK